MDIPHWLLIIFVIIQFNLFQVFYALKEQPVGQLEEQPEETKIKISKTKHITGNIREY